MLGIMANIMEQMVQDNNSLDNNKYNRLLKYISYLPLAMISLVFIIAIILIVSILININSLSNANKKIENIVDKKNILMLSDDELLNKFIKDYYIARTNLNFNQIFMAYNKKWSSTNLDEYSKEIVNSVTHERSYVKKFDDVMVFTVDGLNDDEYIVFMTYNIEFSFTEDLAPSISMAYVKKNDNKYYFLSDYDIEISKYMNNVLKNEEVVSLFNEVKTNLLIALKGNDNLRIAYNSLRQLKDNILSTTDMVAEKNTYNDLLDPINDSDVIEKIVGEE